MLDTNAINKIHIQDTLSITSKGMTTLLFNNGLIVSKTLYSIVDNKINIKEEVINTLNLFYSTGNCTTFEYNINLRQSNTIIKGKDRFGNTLSGLWKYNVLVFVNGYKLLASQYTLNDDNTLTIHNKYTDKITSKVIIYLCQSLATFGEVTKNPTWNDDLQQLEINDYDIKNYLFFKNGQLIPHTQLTYIDKKVTINTPLRLGIDVVEYYRLANDTTNCLFEANPGYFTYGPTDSFGVNLPILYDTVATISQHIARLSIDNVRAGMFIKEEEGQGCLLIVDNDFESYNIKCIQLVPFSKQKYTAEEFYLQVPEARSILKYVSEFDLSGKLFPELLSIFQRLLLDETYDSVQRLKDIRSINRVDSGNLNALINFMGVKLNIKNMTLEEKHNLLEELTNFYRIVGTKTSYNFYNIMSTSSRMVNIEQLFTPIRDINEAKDKAQRYVTFRTAEELGAVSHREYRYPYDDYGDVGTIANPQDSLSNMPRYEGVLEDMERGTITVGEQTYIAPEFKNVKYVWVTDNEGNSVEIAKHVTKNEYTIPPVVGPNKPSEGYDYGYVTEEAIDFYDYGYVWEDIKGEWVEWFEWDRPTNWYPTNHVNVSVEVPPGIDYYTFMDEFKRIFYDIASAVLYIHSVVDVYTFGDDDLWEEGSKPSFGIMSTQLFHQIEYTFTNNPNLKTFVPI